MTLESTTMRRRFAAQFMIEKLLREQGSTPPRTLWARFLGRSPLGMNCEGWYLGAQGEIEVGQKLAALSPEWAVFHALPIGGHGWDIDHVLVGPGGVVTVNTKQHRRQRVIVEQRSVLVDTRPVPYLRHAKFEAERVTTLLEERRPLSTPVIGLVVFVGARSIHVRSSPAPVTVLDAEELVPWLTALPIVLGPADRLGIIELLDDPDMWIDVPLGSGEGLIEGFTRLDAEVRGAALQRRVLLPLETAAAAVAAFIVLNAATTMVVEILAAQ
ncbi:NERD domain-containing protein [Cryobacterium sinapicolor]|uniref:NERD domain-containing protein n=1 Tax=Cryobacterium sinapicolor TaxID=1259236 RepID=A0ABY2ITB4_9MICO|nr:MULTISPECIES: nuclease-related domain-containing protein [Cryobacterium]TFC93186.1 NERD domain-containing protein [Cryobacterium sp. TMT3-29-2]TFC94297.1 NERD domain-containing protein [Cryobacterium sinapicolor]